MATPTLGLDLAGNDLIVRSITTGVSTPATGTSIRTTSSVNAGATYTVTPALNGGRIVNLNATAGSVVTLPAATGTGDTYWFVVTVLATTNSHVVKCANATDTFMGTLTSVLSGTPTTVNVWFADGVDMDTITLNRTTTGSVQVGEWIQCTDIASGFWLVDGLIMQSGTAATPFTDTVG